MSEPNIVTSHLMVWNGDTHNLENRTGEQKTEVVSWGNHFWLLCLVVKTSQHAERQLAAIGYVLKICGDFLDIKATNSYSEEWGYCCHCFPGLLIRIVGGVGFAAMWWMILGSQGIDKPAKHYGQGHGLWALLSKCKIISTSMPATETNSKNVTLLASFLL